MKLGTLVNTTQALSQLLAIKINTDKAFDLALAVKKLEPELKVFEETKNAKIKEYGEEKDGNIQVKPENIQKFQEEIQKLSEKEIDVKFPKLEKEDIKGEIETNILLQLDYLF